MLRKLLSIVCAACMLICLLPAAYAEDETAALSSDGTITLSPAEGSVLNEKPTVFTATADGYESFIFELDGKKLGTANSEGSIAAPESLYYGVHKIVCTGIKADGSAVRAVSNFTYEKLAPLKEAEEDFNTYDGSFSSVGFTVSATAAAPVSAENSPGESGDDGDFAMGVEFGSNTTSGQAGVRWDDIYGYNFKSGYYEYEFDIRLKNPANSEMLLIGPHLWANSYMLLVKGTDAPKWVGTSVELTDNDWHNIKAQVDVKAQTVSFILDGTPVIENIKLKENDLSRCTQIDIRIIQRSEVSDAADRVAFWLDNIKFKHIHRSSGIKNIVYTEGGVDAADSSIVPVNAEAIKVYLNDSLDEGSFTQEGIALTTADGQNVELASASYSAEEQAIICVPKTQLPADTDIFVTLVPGVKFGDGAILAGDYKGRFTTGNPNVETAPVFKISQTKDLFSASQLKVGDVISCSGSVKNITATSKNILYVLTVRKDGRLVAMDTQSFTNLEAGNTGTLALSLPALTENGDYEIYLMNCTDFTQRMALSKLIQIN